MEANLINNLDSTVHKANRPRPVVVVFADAWGVAELNHGNAFLNLKLKTFPNLIKNYPTALINPDRKMATERYQILGALGKLSESLAAAGLSQLNLTESEKVILSWHYFNSGREKLLTGEDLTVISSKIGDRQKDPEQNTSEIISLALRDIKKGLHDVLFINLANLDLISASGNLETSQLAAEALDKGLGQLVSSVLKHNGLLIITAAYGHAEAMINPASDLPELGITDNPVPFIIVSREYQGKNIGFPETLGSDLSLVEPAGTLENVAPTILKLLNITSPGDMPGKSLI